jgi:aspartate/methionine/tyrosine aminotransferase
MLGAKVITISLDPDKNWKLDLNQIEAAFKNSPKLLAMNFPHNPTGTTISLDTLHALVTLARKHNTYIFSDEVFRLMEIDEKDRLPNIADIYEKGISLSVVSKSFGLAGLRIGWIATQDKEFYKKMAGFRLYTTICNSAPSEILALIALRLRNIILNRTREIILSNLRILDNFFQKHISLFSWIPPQGSCITFPKFKHPQPIEEFTNQLVTEKGVLLIPGNIFDFPGNHFRIGFGRKNMPQALERLEEFVKEKYQ